MKIEPQSAPAPPTAPDSRTDGLAEALRPLLPGWSLDPACRLIPLSVSENVVFCAEDDQGRRAAIRVQRPGYQRPDETRSELAWLDALHAAGTVSAPRPLARPGGDRLASLAVAGVPRRAVAFGWLPGKTPDAGEGLAARFAALGALTARLHAHQRSWRRPAGFRRKSWTPEAALGPGGLWGDAAQPFAAPDARRLVRGAAAAVAESLGRYGRDRDRFGLIHADLRLDNLLVGGADPGFDAPAGEETLSVLDFDDCGFGWLVYDFAAAVSFMETDERLPALAERWMEGYRSEAPLPPEAEAMVPVVVMMRRLLLTGWLASRPETDLARRLMPGFGEGTLALAERFLAEHHRRALRG